MSMNGFSKLLFSIYIMLAFMLVFSGVELYRDISPCNSVNAEQTNQMKGDLSGSAANGERSDKT